MNSKADNQIIDVTTTVGIAGIDEDTANTYHSPPIETADLDHASIIPPPITAQDRRDAKLVDQQKLNAAVQQSTEAFMRISDHAPQTYLTLQDLGTIQWTMGERLLLMIDAGLILSPVQRINIGNIREATGLNTREISLLRGHPQYRYALSAFRDKYQKLLMSVALTAKTERIAHIQARHDLATEVVAQRRERYASSECMVPDPGGDLHHVPELESGLYILTWQVIGMRDITIDEGKSDGENKTIFSPQIKLDVDLIRMLERAEADMAAEVGDRRTHLQIETNVKLYGGFDPDDV